MIKKIGFVVTLTTFLASMALGQPNRTMIGDDYARTAMRALIYMNEIGVSQERTRLLMVEADIEASTPSEEASFRELTRIINNWLGTSRDRTACYLALKANLKARNGATPEACK